MKKILTSLFCVLLALSVYCQDGMKMYSKPDFTSLGKTIKDASSPFYFPTLLKRYNADDTTLSIKDYWYLYYGYSFQEAYSPYGKSELNDELKTLLAKKDKTEEEVNKIIELEKAVLKEYPFNLRNLNALVNMYDRKKDTVNADKTYKKMIGIGKAILLSGDGRSDSTAMYVISVEHEYDMIGLMGFEFAGNQKLVQYKGSQLDYMKIEKNDAGIGALYFNVDRLFAKMEEMLKKN